MLNLRGSRPAASRRGGGSGRFHRPAIAATLFVALVTLSACVGVPTTSAPPVASAPPQVAIAAADLVGNWGLASYRDEKDKARTVQQAKAACGNPYKVEAGPNGGALMHLADQAQVTEVFVKVASDGRVFIGPRGPAGVVTDRAVLSFDSGVLVTQWVDRSANERYGIMVFVNCAAPAKKPRTSMQLGEDNHA